MGTKHIIKRVFLLLLLLSTTEVKAKSVADSLKTEYFEYKLNKLLENASKYDKIVRRYESNLYTKGNIHLYKINQLMRTVPQMMSFEKGIKDYIGETLNELNYTYPYMYDRKVVAVYGTFPRMKKESNMIMDYFTVSIYKETLIADHLLSPFNEKNRKYYEYTLDSISDYQVYYSFKPKYVNTQLVNGSFSINRVGNYVEKANLKGKYEFIKFDLSITMGKNGLAVYLPVRYELNFLFSYVGNKMEGHYLTAQHYNKIESSYSAPTRKRKHHHDLTDRYALTVDTAQYKLDSLLVASHRFFPLSLKEQELYKKHAIRLDSSKLDSIKPKSKSRVFWGRFGEALIADYKLNVPTIGMVKCSPIINPILFNYSKSSGYAYRQDFKYTIIDDKNRYFRLAPRLGYNFTFKEFYWRVYSAYEYYPKRSARLEIEIGNGKRSYNSNVLDEIKKTHDNIDFDKLHLDYFNNLYAYANHRFEIVNGLYLTTGLTIHRRTPIKKTEIIIGDENIKKHYTSFAPRIRIDYTPGLYYYWNNNRKENIYSPFPTFSLDWERSIKGPMGSNSVYERWEFEMNYQLRIDALRKLCWQVGGGIFTNQKTTYFADFHNFKHSHLPNGWDDELGGTFQLLDGRWYNSANKYIRGHLVYDAPLLALSKLKGITHPILSERVYLSALVMPKLTPYTEIGYGVATHIFDVGFFVSFIRAKYNEIGLKFTFELFNR